MSILTRPIAEVPRLLLTTREAAEALGIAERTLWGLTSPRGPIPALRLPGRGRARALRYALVDLQIWIERQKTATPPAFAGGAE